MIDINILRTNPASFKKATADKQLDAKLIDVALMLDGQYRQKLQSLEQLRSQRNLLSKDPTPQNIKQAKTIKTRLKSLEAQTSKLKTQLQSALAQIPNPAAADVKPGKNEDENEVLEKIGKPAKFNFLPKAYWELGEQLGIVDTKRAAKVSGSRFFYLKGDGVLLDQAIVRLGFETLIQKGFTPILPPVLIKTDAMAGMGYMDHGGDKDMYTLPKDDLVLVATSEQSIGPMHREEVFSAKDLPKRYLGYSSCFRREAGSYGKDTKGAFRVHQFNKLEMFSFVKPEDGDKEHQFMLSIEKELLDKLKLPYQVVKMCSGDLGLPAARKYDLEAWFPSENKYRELTSTSTVTDFQARRLNIKYQDKAKLRYVHMLNGTVFSQRPIMAILENYQQKDGSVKIPQVLQPYMMGKKIIKGEV